jgi:hypothetical protein
VIELLDILLTFFSQYVKELVANTLMKANDAKC